MSKSACALIIGNFDGVHRGHQAIINTAATLGSRVVALTFAPHPRRYFQPTTAPFLLTNNDDKIRWLKHYGVADVITLSFNKTLALLSPDDFYQQQVQPLLGTGTMLVGHDFCFGYQRAGTTATLAQLTASHGASLKILPPQGAGVVLVFSSSAARAAVAQGAMAEAQTIIGRPFTVTGVVRAGEQRGRQLGFPTANIELGEYQRPRYGVYCVKAYAAGQLYYGVANCGVRPTIGGQKELLEAHFFGIIPNLYGRELVCELWHFLRPEIKWPDLSALAAQLARDVMAAKTYWNQYDTRL